MTKKIKPITDFLRPNESYSTMSEDRLQQICYMWWNNNFIEYNKLLFAVPNGGDRDEFQGKILKWTGLVPGVSDLIFLWNGKSYLLELKKPSGGIQSKHQKEFERQVKEQSFYYTLINTPERFQHIILNIINKG